MGVDGSAAGALEIGILKNDDWCIGGAFDVVADVAVIRTWCDDGRSVFFVAITFGGLFGNEKCGEAN